MLKSTAPKNPVIDIAALSGTRVLTLLLAMAQVMILSRAYNKLDYGTYSQGLIVIQIMTTLTGFGLSSAVNYFLAQAIPFESKRKYFNTITGINVLSGVVGGLLLLVFRNFIAEYFSNPMLAALIIYIAFRPMVANLVTNFQNSFIANSMARMISVRNLIIVIIELAIIGFAAWMKYDISVIFVLLIALDLAQLLYFFLITKKLWYTVSFFKISPELVREILAYAVPMALALMVGTLNIEVDKLLIGYFFSTEQLAEYANMSKELPFSFIALSISTVMLPKIIRAYKNGDKELARKFWANSISIGFIFTSLLCMAAILLSKEVIVFLYSEKYAGGDPIFIVFVLVQMIRFTYFGTILNAAGKTKLIFIFSVLALVMNTVLSLLFYYFFGYYGPAYATLISIGFIAFIQLVQSKKYLECSLPDLINFKDNGVFLAILLLLLIPFNYLRIWLHSLGWSSTVVMATVGILYTAASAALYFKKIRTMLVELINNNKQLTLDPVILEDPQANL
jgi:O-antigen/teichoic acid export membrane protein